MKSTSRKKRGIRNNVFLIIFGFIEVLLFSLTGVRSVYAASEIPLDAAHFPCEEFRTYLGNLADLNKNGTLSGEEIQAVTRMYVNSNKGTLTEYDITGVEYFTELRDFECTDRILEKADFTHNVKLESLSISHSRFEAIDLSKNTLLQRLSLDSNVKIRKLDVSQNTKLTKLSVNQSGLEELDVTKNTQLENLNVFGNSLSEINLSNNQSLRILSIGNNPDIKGVDISRCKKLESLNIGKMSITAIDTTQNPKLQTVEANETPLVSIDVSRNPELEYLYVNKGKLTEIDVSKNIKLKGIMISENQLKNLDLSKNVQLSSVAASNNRMTRLKLSGCTKIASIYAAGNELESLDLSDNLELRELNISNNRLKEIDLSHNTKLTKVYLSGNQFTKLDLSGNTELTDIKIDDNELTEIDLSKNVKLVNASFNNNHLKSINLLQNTALYSLCAANNLLTALNTKNNLKLHELNISNNAISSLELSNNMYIRYLYVDHNQLTSLEIPGNASMTHLGVTNNHLLCLNLENVTSNSLTIRETPIYSEIEIPWDGHETYDLAQVPGLDIERVSGVTGATLEGTVLKPEFGLISGNSEDLYADVYYDYDTMKQNLRKVRFFVRFVTGPNGVSVTPSPSAAPTAIPSLSPSEEPSEVPEVIPTILPSAIPADQVQSFKVSGKEKKIVLSWNRAAGVKEYKIYRASKKTGKWKCIADVTNTKYVDKKVAMQKTYYYKVMFIGQEGSSGSSAIKKGKTWGLIRPVISVKKKKTAGGSRYLNLIIKKYQGAKLQVYVKTGRKYKKLRLVSSSLRKKRKFKIGYQRLKGTIKIKVRTIGKKRKKSRYSVFSKVAVIKIR